MKVFAQLYWFENNKHQKTLELKIYENKSLVNQNEMEAIVERTKKDWKRIEAKLQDSINYIY